MGSKMVMVWRAVVRLHVLMAFRDSGGMLGADVYFKTFSDPDIAVEGAAAAVSLMLGAACSAFLPA